jgi:hypothetical protein
MDGECVHLDRQLVGKQFIDEAVAREAGLACEIWRDDEHAEMALARLCLRTVAGVQMRLVDDFQAGGPEGLLQALSDGCGNRHVQSRLFYPQPTAVSSQEQRHYSRYATDSTDWTWRLG